MVEKIETERLILRAPKKTDAKAFYNYAKKSTIGPLAGWLPHESITHSKIILNDFIKTEDVWVINIKPSNQMVGSISLKFRNIEEAIKGICEIGYALDDTYWNQGYISEAVTAILDVAFNKYDVKKVIAGHDISNKASQRVILKHGFKFTHIDTSRVFSNPDIHEVYMYELNNPKNGE